MGLHIYYNSTMYTVVNMLQEHIMLVNDFLYMQLLENDIQSHQDHIDDIMSRVRRFRDNNHFQIDLIEDRGRELVAK